MEVFVVIDGKSSFKIELAKGFFGILQLQFVNEELVLIRKEESIKPQIIDIII